MNMVLTMGSRVTYQLSRLRRPTREQRKLLFSVGLNFLTRVPGAIGLLWFLPLLRFGLGTEDYSDLLASLALGTAAIFLIWGFNTIGRRVVGEAYAADDHAAQANGFISLIVTNCVAAIFSAIFVGMFGWLRGEEPVLVLIALLPVITGFFSLFDDVRAAFNEHYINALLLLIFQSCAYLIGFLVLVTQKDILLAALVLSSPYILTSVVSGVYLLWHRPYLLAGQPTVIRQFLSQGMMVAMADSFLLATLSLSVVWLQTTIGSANSAWFATMVRLFQTFLAPVLLLLFPLSSYIRLRWNTKSRLQQQTFIKLTVSLGMIYGSIVAFALFVSLRFYVQDLLNLPLPTMMEIVPIFICFGAIIAYKTYASIAYLVIDNPTHLSSRAVIAIGGAVAIAAGTSLLTNPLIAVNVYAAVTGLALLVVVARSAAVEFRPLRLQTS